MAVYRGQGKSLLAASRRARAAVGEGRKYGLVGGIGHPPRRSVRDSPPADLRPLPQLSGRWCAAVDAADGPTLMIDLVIIRPILAVERDGAPEGEVIEAPAVPLP